MQELAKSLIQAEIQLHLPCPNCPEEKWRVDHLQAGQSVTWACDRCHNEFHIVRIGNPNSKVFEVIPTGKKETPITVTLQSRTTPKIILRINAWKYAHSQNDTPEEFRDSEEYFYNEHTCPTNFLGVEQVEFEGDKDPHGVFEFVSVEEGHLDSLEEKTIDVQQPPQLPAAQQ